MSVRDQLVALAKLGRIDASTQDLDRELREIPKEVDKLRESVALLEGLLSRERTQLAAAETLFAQQESLVKEANDSIARTKAKSAKAKNAREAEAAERELEAVRRGVKDREVERERLEQAIAQVKGSLTQHETEFSGLRDVLAEKDAVGQKRIAELNAQRDQALTGRGDLVALIPRDIVTRYDALRARKGTAVAEMKDGICLGCRMSVRPMQSIVIQREEGVERCAHCQRYLYWGPWLLDDPGSLEAGER